MAKLLTIVLAVAIVIAACSAAPSNEIPTPSAVAGSTSAPANRTEPPSAPTPSVDPELGAQPDAEYPESSAIGIGTLRITRPRPDVARWWIACEWSTTERVSYLYNGDGSADEPGGSATVLGESVTPTVWRVIEGPSVDFGLSREDIAADYRIDPGTATLTHAPDWSSGTLTFEHLALDPESWGPGPLPTPKAQFERPLGGDPDALDLAGTFEWECGPRPASVPTPGPPEPRESFAPFPALPHARLTVGGASHAGIDGCGLEWGFDGQLSGAADCGSLGVPVKPFAEELPRPISVVPREALTFTLPKGFHFVAWRFEYLDEPTAELYRGEWPLDHVVLGDRDRSASAEVVVVDGPPSGDWMALFTFTATNGSTIVAGRKEFFRLVAAR